MITIYGIKNCDTVKKALLWCRDRGIAHQFHDFRQEGLDRALLESWAEELGVLTLLNKRGTTWRKLPDNQKDNLNEKEIIELLLEYPAMIKRPVFDLGAVRHVGFSQKDQEEIGAILGVAASPSILEG